MSSRKKNELNIIQETNETEEDSLPSARSSLNFNNMVYNRYNLRPTLSLPYNLQPKSIYVGFEGLPNHYYKRNIF